MAVTNTNSVIKWTSDPQKKLQALDLAVRKRILKKSVRAGLKPVQRRIKDLARGHKRTGALATSIGSSVDATKDGFVTARIGARRKYKKTVKGQTIRPSRYLHLVVFGRKAIKAKSGRLRVSLQDGRTVFPVEVAAAQGDNFLDAGLQQTRAQYYAIANQTLAAEIAKELAKK